MNNEIYPLDKDYVGSYGIRIELSVNERLRPIFKALLRDPEGWELEVEYESGKWKKANRIPISDPNIASSTLDYIRLVRKKPKKPKTITVEIPMPDHVSSTYGNGGSVNLHYFNEKDSDNRVSEAICLIRKAMEGK